MAKETNKQKAEKKRAEKNKGSLCSVLLTASSLHRVRPRPSDKEQLFEQEENTASTVCPCVCEFKRQACVINMCYLIFVCCERKTTCMIQSVKYSQMRGSLSVGGVCVCVCSCRKMWLVLEESRRKIQEASRGDEEEGEV